MRIKIVSACDDNMKVLSDISYPTIEKYCQFWNFSCERFNIKNFNRPASWYKISLLINEIDSNQFDYIMWVDSDAIIYNQNFDLRSLLRADKDFYLSKDLNNFNCGVFIIKCSDFSKSILEKIDSMSEYVNHIWWEQGAFIELFESNFNNIQDKVQIVDQNILNAYDYRFYGESEFHLGQYNKNSFVVHFPALPYHFRIDLMKNLL